MIRPSRFIDAAKKGQNELLTEFWNDPEKSIEINKIDPIYMTALHWAARGGHAHTSPFETRAMPLSLSLIHFCFCSQIVARLGRRSKLSRQDGRDSAAQSRLRQLCRLLLAAARRWRQSRHSKQSAQDCHGSHRGSQHSLCPRSSRCCRRRRPAI